MSDHHNGCFSPYMLISSTLQTVFGFDRRSDQDKQADIAQQHQLEMRRAKEEFQDELEAQKIADMRAKMAVARKYRAEERFDQTVLQHRTEELKAFFMRFLPIKQQAIPILLETARSYRQQGYDINCPLNVVLLHTRQNDLNYDTICDKLEKPQAEIGNIAIRRWCDKDLSHNSALLNLHAIMGNIPTLVISPYFNGGKIHFTASMWEAQSEEKPLIRPLFSIDCPSEYISGHHFTPEGKKAIENRIALISSIISGCARDSYVLITQGLAPTLPRYLANHPEVVRLLSLPENKQICEFMLGEYNAAQALLATAQCQSNLLTQGEMNLLATEAKVASEELQKLTSKSLAQ